MATTLIKGNGSPEGFIESSKGTFYINTQALSVFVKMKGEGITNTGWRAINMKGFYENAGSPEGVVPAPKYAVCLDTTNNVLYMQAKTSTSIIDEGWVSLNEGDTLSGTVDPNVGNILGKKGDIYINTDAVSLFVYSGGAWENVLLMSVDTTNTMTQLAELLTNTTSVVSQYFNIFLNPNPMDVELTQYDQNGILKTYVIPNRAKDTVALVGESSPEGTVYGSRGQIYLDITTGIPYIKTTGANEADGWTSLRRPNVADPVVYDEVTNTIQLAMDSHPTENSSNMVNSGTVYTELGKIRNGSTEEVFAVAEPVLPEHATNKRFVSGLIDSMYGYDASTRTLVINAPLNKEVTETATIIGQAGKLYTPMFGTAYSTIFTFNSAFNEASGKTTYIHSEIPCEIVVHAGIDYTIDLTATKKSDKLFSTGMTGGITTLQITSSTYYDYPTVNVIKDLYKKLTITQV